jgi:hypothetical protein
VEAAMSDGFLGRWSRRKLDVKQGKPVEPEPQSPAEQLPPARPLAANANEEAARSPAPANTAPEVQAPAAPTLEDVEKLTPQSDFKRFAGADVTPEVKNAAMKKLFADPRYNVMDGLDVYIDDYSTPDPIPQSMLRQLAAGKFLGLFQEEKSTKEQATRQPRDVADNPKPQIVAQSGSASQSATQSTDADPDLQLQQDHAASGEDPGRGTG